MKLWLVRHGETEANVAGLYSGHAPTPLTAKGQQQAQRLGEMLRQVPFDHALCSGLERTQHTARLLLGERNIPLTANPLLNEMFFGDWEMRHHRDLQVEDKENYAAWCADWQHAAPTNGEGFPDFSRRVADFANELAHYPYQNLLIVSHQGVLSLLTARLLGMPTASMWHFRIDHGAWSVIDFTPEFTTLRVLNSRAIWRPDE
ncbi:alpha-ribazole phosphatase [Kluyvera genomosp. 3]|uniref:Alpha-ribazole phosphatase n=1 Tax=Kluyvera genomosp. 3 TaxID=2774055 RepID=A0A248KJV6_9ENTR|nr:alpha-ribazole phosphatase [Kluyvera genomosp. 3]